MSRARLTVILAGAAVAVAAALIFLIGGSDEYVVRAELQNASGLRRNASVKIAGVPGGKVEKVEITGRDTAIATLKLKQEAAPIGRGATIQIRPTDLLGERYADMDPGDVSKPQPSGSLIPLKRTQAPVELDDVLNMLDVDTRTRLKIMINEFGIALGGRGADFHQILEEMPTALDKARALVGEVASENVKLKQLIVQGDRITATIHPKRDKLGDLVTEASRMLGAVAARRQQLGQTVANAPGALTQLRATLTRLDSASASLRPAARDLRRAASPLAATLRALPAFADSAKGTLVKARSVAPVLRRLGVGATPTVKRLEPTAGLLRDVAHEATPGLAQLDRRGMEDLLNFVQVWARAMKGRDNLGHFIGALVIGNEQAFQSAIDSYVNSALNPTTADKGPKTQRPPLRLPTLPPVTLPKVKVPPLPKVKIPPLPKVKLPPLPKVELPKVDKNKIKEVPKALDRKLKDLIGPDKKAARQQQQSPRSDALRLFDYLFGS
ncbi:MAG: phospholipid/cholesterol/gamma-HCH transport system substrate-binding protein [Solirubrobacteraceae bacterium]|nr:phospholipid/cholesterol/gamma-HCH transport system substrate-binding protein [Solirubrobacteraceae bacterium]